MLTRTRAGFNLSRSPSQAGSTEGFWSWCRSQPILNGRSGLHVAVWAILLCKSGWKNGSVINWVWTQSHALLLIIPHVWRTFRYPSDKRLHRHCMVLRLSLYLIRVRYMDNSMELREVGVSLIWTVILLPASLLNRDTSPLLGASQSACEWMTSPLCLGCTHCALDLWHHHIGTLDSFQIGAKEKELFKWDGLAG